MHEHLGSFKQNPSKKFCKNLINFEKPKKNFKDLKTYIYMNKMHEKEGKQDLTSEGRINLG